MSSKKKPQPKKPAKPSSTPKRKAKATRKAASRKPKIKPARRVPRKVAEAAETLSCSNSARRATKEANRTNDAGIFKVTRAHARARTRHMLFCRHDVLYEQDNQQLDPPVSEQSRRALLGPVNFHWFDDVAANATEAGLAGKETFGALWKYIHGISRHLP